MASRTHQLGLDLLLLLAAFFWGTTFIVVKNAVARADVFVFLFARFSTAFILMAILFYKRVWPISLQTFRSGIFLGLILFAAFAFQTWGLIFTSATNSAFLTSLHFVIVPILSLIFLRRAPAPFAAAGILIAFAGLYFLTGGTPLQWNRGDLLVFICAAWFALHIMMTGNYATRFDTLSLATWQLGAVAIMSLAFSLGTGSFTLSLPVPVWGAVGVTAVFCSVFAYAVQTHVQRFTPPSRTALILTAEPVFGAFFANWYGGEALLEKHWLGGGLIFLGMILAEIRPAVWRQRSPVKRVA